MGKVQDELIWHHRATSFRNGLPFLWKSFRLPGLMDNPWDAFRFLVLRGVLVRVSGGVEFLLRDVCEVGYGEII